MKTSGVVVEVHKRNTVAVYTNDGQFINIPAPSDNLKPGDVIEVIQPKTGLFRKRSFATRILPTAAAVLALVMFLSMYLSFFSAPVSAYVALDMNPSIELTVDKNAKVIEVTHINNDADKLLKNLKLKEQDVYEATDLIIEKAISLGYLSVDKQNMVAASVIPVGENSVIAQDKLQSIIKNKMQTRMINGLVIVNTSNEQIREDAAKNGLSVNRYMVMEHYQESGMNISASEINSKNMMDLMKDVDFKVGKNAHMETVNSDNHMGSFDENTNNKNMGNQSMQTNTEKMDVNNGTSEHSMPNNMNSNSSKSGAENMQQTGSMKDGMSSSGDISKQTMVPSREDEMNEVHDKNQAVPYFNNNMNQNMLNYH